MLTNQKSDCGAHERKRHQSERNREFLQALTECCQCSIESRKRLRSSGRARLPSAGAGNPAYQERRTACFDDGPLVPDGGLTRYAWLNGFYDTDSPGRVIWKQFTTGKQLNRYGSERQTRDSPSATIRSGGRSRQMTGQRQTGGPQLLFEFGSRFVVGQLIDFDPIGPTLRFGRCHARIRGEAFFWRRLPSVHNRGRFGLMVGSLPR